MSKKIIKLKESDIENIVKRVLQEQEEEINIEQPGIEITLDQIAMLLSDGECECGGERNINLKSKLIFKTPFITLGVFYLLRYL